MKRYTSAPAAVAAGVILALACGVFAKPKPNPIPYKPKGPAPIDHDGFAKAYLAAGEPRLVVSCVLAHAGKTGRAAVDASEVCDKLQSDISGQLLKTPGVELVDVKLARQAELRRQTLQVQRGVSEPRSGEDVGEHPADLHFLVELTPTPNRRAGRYRCTVTLCDLARGRTIAQFGFDWVLGTDARSIGRYGLEITRRVVEQFNRWYDRPGGDARTYTANLVGVRNFDDLMKAKRAFTGLPGVQSIRSRGFVQGAESGIARLRIRYAGDSMELLYELQEAARAKLGMKVSGMDTNAGAITLEMNPRLANRQKWTRFIETGTPEFDQAKRALSKAYLAQDQPRIAVLFARELALSNPEDAGVIREYQRKANEQRIPLTPAPLVTLKAMGVTRAGSSADQLMDLRMLEDRVIKAMLPMGLRLVDPKQIVRNPPKPAVVTPMGVYAEEQLPSLVANLGGMDVLVYVVARQSGRGDEEHVEYSARAIRLADNLTMSADSWSSRRMSEIPVSYRKDPAGAVGGLLAGRMLDQMLRFWSNPNLMLVRVERLGSQRDLMAILNGLRDNVAGVGSVRMLQCDTDDEGQMYGLLEVRGSVDADEIAKGIDRSGSAVPAKVGEVREATTNECSMLGGDAPSEAVAGSAPLRTVTVSLQDLDGFSGEGDVGTGRTPAP